MDHRAPLARRGLVDPPTGLVTLVQEPSAPSGKQLLRLFRVPGEAHRVEAGGSLLD